MAICVMQQYILQSFIWRIISSLWTECSPHSPQRVDPPELFKPLFSVGHLLSLASNGGRGWARRSEEEERNFQPVKAPQCSLDQISKIEAKVRYEESLMADGNLPEIVLLPAKQRWLKVSYTNTGLIMNSRGWDFQSCVNLHTAKSSQNNPRG